MAHTLKNYKDSVLYFAKAANDEYGYELTTFEEFLAAAALDDYVTGWRNHDWVEREDDAELIINNIAYSPLFDDVCEFFDTDPDYMLAEGARYVDSAIRLWVLETQVADELREYWEEAKREMEEEENES